MTDKTPLSTEPYKGVHDYYPEDWAKVQAVFDVLRSTLKIWGFEEYQASPLERAEIYESKTSEEIVNNQTYTFTDRGDRRVTLRPEMTPTLARMVSGKRRELIFPLRWFSIGNRFRYERPQKGRSREFYQCDVDIIGISGAQAEGEAVVIASQLLTALGATERDFHIRINSRSLINAAGNALGLSTDETTSYLSLIDRKDKIPAETFETERDAFRRDGRDPLELIESHADEATEAEYQKITSLIEAFSARGMTNVSFDPTIARGFLYYTGLIFEVYDTNPENPRALMGGGRYDGLVALFGGDPIPAMGFAVGIETLIDFLTTHNLVPAANAAPQVFIGTPSPSDFFHAQTVAQILRDAGVRVIVNGSEKALGDQVKETLKRGIPYFIAIGEQEATSNTVKIKTLAESKETEMLVEQVSAYIRENN